MPIRAKLLLSMTLLVAAGFIISGFVVVTQVRGYMLERVDATLLTSREKASKPGGGWQSSDRNGSPSGNPGYGSTRRSLAAFLIDSNGTILRAEPSGYFDDPDPYPDLAGIQEQRPGTIHTASASDGSSLRYRVLVSNQRNGQIDVLASPLDDVDETIRQLTLVIGVTGALIVVVLSVISWVVIRRGLAPVHDMAATATLVADGDLTQRVDYENPNTEVGQLGMAFNSMVSQIETAFGEKDASERRLRQFVADASHELRTPITSIRGYAELYRSGAASTPDEIDRAISRIESEGIRMGRLVEDLLLLARLDQGRPLEQKPVDLVQVGEDAVSDARVVEPDRPIHFESSGPAVVTGDQDRLHQVMANLLSNTRLHTAPGTPVDVSMMVDNDTVTILVQDAGEGISAEDLDHIFDRFYRVDTARSRAEGGSGLGLSIVASVVQAHRGQVEVRSTPGEGTIFAVRLPLEHRDDTVVVLTDRSTATMAESGPKPLIAQPKPQS